MTEVKEVPILRQAIKDFTLEFVKEPYLCYTEHGQHARFYAQLSNALPGEEQYFLWGGKKVCVIQKEYPTTTDLDRTRRQHWDISLIKNPPEIAMPEEPRPYDFFILSAAVEFGLNESFDHLENDIERLCHPEANVENPFLVHLYRLTNPGNQRSRRDLSNGSNKIVSIEKAAKMTKNNPVEIFYGIYDDANSAACGAWRLYDGKIEEILLDHNLLMGISQPSTSE